MQIQSVTQFLTGVIYDQWADTSEEQRANGGQTQVIFGGEKGKKELEREQ